MRETYVLLIALIVGAQGVWAQNSSSTTPQGTSGSSHLADSVLPNTLAVGSGGSPQASVLPLIKFSGTAQDAVGRPLAGLVGVTFALYEEQEGGAPLWLETQNVRLDSQGRYSVLLGASSNEGLPLEIFASGKARWLGIQVQGQAQQRVLLVSVPYALKAAEAETLSGKTASDFILSEQLTTEVEEEINTQIESQGLMTTEEAGNLAQVTGSGTVGQIAKFVTPTEVGDSVITEANGRIGIGFATPVQKLVIGATGGRMLNVSNLANQDLEIRLSTRFAADRHALIAPTTPTNLALGVGGQEKMRITNLGQVGIANSFPGATLHVGTDDTNGRINIGSSEFIEDAGGLTLSIGLNDLIVFGLFVPDIINPNVAVPGGTDPTPTRIDSTLTVGTGGVPSVICDPDCVTNNDTSPNDLEVLDGDIIVSGTVTKSGGNFRIDHPLDPANKYLNHSFVESPDMKNVYDGVARLDASGEAVVELPAWFGALNSDFRYQLTSIGGFAPVYIASEIRNNRFTIAGGQPGMKVSWQVTGIRQDAFARDHRIQVEEEKPQDERGYYLYPQGFGQSSARGISVARRLKIQPATQRGRGAADEVQMLNERRRMTSSRLRD